MGAAHQRKTHSRDNDRNDNYKCMECFVNCWQRSMDQSLGSGVFAPDVQHKDGGDEDQRHDQYRDWATVL